MDYTKLNAVIATMPGEATATDAEVLAWGDAKTIVRDKDIETTDIKKYLVLVDKWLPLKQSTDPSALVTMDALSIFGTFRLTDPDTGAQVKAKLVAMLDALAAITPTPLIDAAVDKPAILAMGTETISEFEVAGLYNVKLGDVIEARSGRY